MSSMHFKFWGKSGRDEGEDSYHPVAFHCLDVAASGRVLLKHHPLLRYRLEQVSGLQGDRLVGWVSFLLGFHDLGKLADGFQNLRPDLLKRLQGRVTQAGYSERHDLLGYRLWCEGLRKKVIGDDECIEDLVDPWVQAATGHHGEPPRMPLSRQCIDRQFPEPVLDYVYEVVTWLTRRFLAEGPPFAPEPYEAQLRASCRASWLFAGLAVAADWIGSNGTWFPFCEERLELDEYWQERSLPQARRAVAETGLTEIAPSVSAGLGSLWPELERPTELQSLAESLELADGAQMLILEEVTGGGKTEAALVLAHRLLERRLANGLYVALPTMATANAMYERISRIYERLFGETGASLVLAHSKRHLMGLEEPPPDRAYRDDEPTASQMATAWLADSRKKSLLAQVGVGTIDQALLGVLPVRHQSLRLWGTAGKVLVVDEVHAADTYVRELLKRLLSFHAAFGGSVILLSATLPSTQREELITAYAAGLGYGPPEGERTGDYPLTTHLAAGHFDEHPTAARDEARRRVEVEPLRAEANVYERIAREAEAGRCACWVRNSIDDAIEGWQELSDRLGAERVQLFHSRFTVCDRARIERDVLARFGPKSGPEERAGRVLVATQVVEQSLDLDFDYLVSDLAPIDLVVQRAGRMRRHRRDGEGRRIDRADERGPAILGLHAPAPVPDAGEDWYETPFPRGAIVYPDHGRLWLTARWLEEHKSFRVPEDSRKLVEFVYGSDSDARIPESLKERATKVEGETQAEKALARINALKLDRGYRAERGQWPEDAYAPTRLGEPTVTLRLVRHTDGGYEAWHAGEPHEWEMSELRVRESQAAEADDTLSDELFADLASRMSDEGRFVVLAVLKPTDEGWETATHTPRGEIRRWRYDGTTGLRLIREEESQP